MVLQDIGPRRLDGGPATEVQLLWSPASKEAKKGPKIVRQPVA